MKFIALKYASAFALAMIAAGPSVAQAPATPPSQATDQSTCPMGGRGPHAMMGSGQMGSGMMGGQADMSNWQEMREQMQGMRQQMQAMHQEMTKLRQEMQRPR